jgi:hypothetical protein
MRKERMEKSTLSLWISRKATGIWKFAYPCITVGGSILIVVAIALAVWQSRDQTGTKIDNVKIANLGLTHLGATEASAALLESYFDSSEVSVTHRAVLAAMVQQLCADRPMSLQIVDGEPLPLDVSVGANLSKERTQSTSVVIVYPYNDEPSQLLGPTLEFKNLGYARLPESLSFESLLSYLRDYPFKKISPTDRAAVLKHIEVDAIKGKPVPQLARR